MQNELRFAVITMIAIALSLIVATPQVYGITYEYFRVSGPHVKGMHGGNVYELPYILSIVDSTRTNIYDSPSGRPVMIEHTINNTGFQRVDEQVVVWTEVRDDDGFTLFFALQSIDLAVGQSGKIGTSWQVPSDAQVGDVYIIRTFMLTSASPPKALGTIFNGEINIVPPGSDISPDLERTIAD